MLQGEARDKGCQGKTVMLVGDVQQQHEARTIKRDIQVKRLTYWARLGPFGTGRALSSFPIHALNSLPQDTIYARILYQA